MTFDLPSKKEMNLYIMHVASVYIALQYWYGTAVSHVMHLSNVIDCD